MVRLKLPGILHRPSLPATSCPADPYLRFHVRLTTPWSFKLHNTCYFLADVGLIQLVTVRKKHQDALLTAAVEAMRTRTCVTTTPSQSMSLQNVYDELQPEADIWGSSSRHSL